ncbi:hypothetical protein [Microbacterium sp. H6]|uniref:hypothetical protein n=1 Tax=Microbacterium sp. H6 TaxID=421122 RepID=UPI000DE423FD|nr:hypothetical protein [Microbacterium sp. H6]RBO72824.1 hypothetical protein DSP71_08850 [Microbacterium sp. H6]
MSEYAPSTRDIREMFHIGMFSQHKTPARLNLPAFDRWLAAHDAEVRAGVVAEEPEWEYGWRSLWPDGEEYEWQALPNREAAEEAIRIHQDFEDNTDQIGGRLEFTLWKRTKSKAGPWVPVKQENDND